eukprot:TRINITY_DN43366_c0_g1_i1.p2 TRINITY_DN43366_c0_g1~~TRINITY_DN43366_c0_g1_i1.p2  ORF type:complete len:113 (-),score=10.78 TRINITY_DN43366_c0_g1_i1:225-563(-)
MGLVCHIPMARRLDLYVKTMSESTKLKDPLINEACGSDGMSTRCLELHATGYSLQSHAFLPWYANESAPRLATAPAGMNFPDLIARGAIPATSTALVAAASECPLKSSCPIK